MAQRDLDRHPEAPDRVSDAIEVLRMSALTTYENRRIETGVLLFGRMPDPCHALPPNPVGALRYSTTLTGIRSFYRLCDGLQTVALVDPAGRLADLVDVQAWAAPYADMPLPVPTVERYRAHARATLCGGHVGLVLTPNGEIKVFAEGAEVFHFIDGRWRLTDARPKYEVWRQAVDDERLAERLFTMALDLAEDRRGALFVVLEDVARAETLVPAVGASRRRHVGAAFRIEARPSLSPARPLPPRCRAGGGRERRLHRRRHGARPGREPPRFRCDPPPRRRGRRGGGGGGGRADDGGHRRLAVRSALMVSEDGLVSFFRRGRRIWQL